MNFFITGLLILVLQNVSSQSKSFNDIKSFENHYTTMKQNSELLVVWGVFQGYGKFPELINNQCKAFKDINKRKFKSSLSFHLFSDTSTNYLPISEIFNISKPSARFKKGDFIKLKIRIYKNCIFYNKKLFFIIEDII